MYPIPASPGVGSSAPAQQFEPLHLHFFGSLKISALFDKSRPKSQVGKKLLYQKQIFLGVYVFFIGAFCAGIMLKTLVWGQLPWTQEVSLGPARINLTVEWVWPPTFSFSSLPRRGDFVGLGSRHYPPHPRQHSRGPGTGHLHHTGVGLLPEHLLQPQRRRVRWVEMEVALEGKECRGEIGPRGAPPKPFGSAAGQARLPDQNCWCCLELLELP